MSEDQVRQKIRDVVSRQFSSGPVRVRRPAGVEIWDNGIQVGLSLSITIDNPPDPRVYVSFLITLTAVDGDPVAAVGSTHVEFTVTERDGDRLTMAWLDSDMDA